MNGAPVLGVVSEIYPLIKTGGLADVAGALPAALAPEGFAVTTLVPGYPLVLAALEEAGEAARFAELFGGPARLLRAHAKGLDLFVLDAPHLYARERDPYRGPDQADWPDNALRFGALSKVAALIARGMVAAYAPAIVHAHDWQAALTLAYLRYGEGARPGTVMTVHNLAFPGRFPHALLATLGLPPAAWSIDGVEFFGDVAFLKAGLQFADRITTVSPTYAMEIATPEAGMGFDGLLRARRNVLSGILNGIDERVWNPAADPAIAAPYTALKLTRRRKNKAALEERLGLRALPEAPLFGVISRLTRQKGLDLLLGALDEVLPAPAELVLLGTGEAELEAGFAAAAAREPERIAAVIGYDEALAHQIQAGADVLLVPSRFEPCGLTQLAALRYGALPLVARVGGLADSVIDANEAALAQGVATGFQFAPVTTAKLREAIRRADALWREPKAWRQVQRNAMRSDVSWRRPAARYGALYRGLIAERTKLGSPLKS